MRRWGIRLGLSPSPEVCANSIFKNWTVAQLLFAKWEHWLVWRKLPEVKCESKGRNSSCVTILRRHKATAEDKLGDETREMVVPCHVAPWLISIAWDLPSPSLLIVSSRVRPGCVSGRVWLNLGSYFLFSANQTQKEKPCIQLGGPSHMANEIWKLWVSRACVGREGFREEAGMW